MTGKLAIVCLGLCTVLGAAYIFPFGRYAIGPIDRKIVSKINDNCAHQRPCVFLLEEGITDSSWDTMHMFSDRVNQHEVESVLHMHLTNFQEFSGTLAFTDQGKVTHWEQTPRSLNFEMPEGLNYMAYPPGTLFSVSIQHSGMEPYYLLRQWPCKPGSHDSNGKACPLPE